MDSKGASLVATQLFSLEEKRYARKKEAEQSVTLPAGVSGCAVSSPGLKLKQEQKKSARKKNT